MFALASFARWTAEGGCPYVNLSARCEVVPFLFGEKSEFLSVSVAAYQLAAAFGSLRQTRSIPSAAEGLNQQDCARHTTSQDIDLRDFIRERGSLRGGHFQIARDPTLIASD